MIDFLVGWVLGLLTPFIVRYFLPVLEKKLKERKENG
jgi:hypothetical protein